VRTLAYSMDEDKMLCEAWMEMGQNAILGAEQTGTAFWKRVHDQFHEQRCYEPHKFESDRNETSLQKRWAFIQSEFSKFVGAYEDVERRPVSGIGIKDLV